MRIPISNINTLVPHTICDSYCREPYINQQTEVAMLDSKGKCVSLCSQHNRVCISDADTFSVLSDVNFYDFSGGIV